MLYSSVTGDVLDSGTFQSVVVMKKCPRCGGSFDLLKGVWVDGDPSYTAGTRALVCTPCADKIVPQVEELPVVSRM